MRQFLLDTTPLAAYLIGRPPAVAMIDPWLDRGEAATSIPVYGEVSEYLMGRPRFPERLWQLRLLLRQITPLFLNYAILDRYALLGRSLRPPHGPGLIGDIDVLIAATALEQRLTVVTTDRNYTRVAGLSVLLLDRATLTATNGPLA